MEGNILTGLSNLESQGPDYLGFVPLVFWVERGEGIGETVLSHFENRENFPEHLREKTCFGVILSASGKVLHPEVAVPESTIVFDGEYQIQDISCVYDIPKDGDVRVSGCLRASFYGVERLLGGPLVGPLVAATPIEVIVLIAELKESTYWR